jgi:hypothetical protein
MDRDTVTADILTWSENFVEVPHPSLGGFPPCPFARQARMKRSFEVYLGSDPYYDLKNRARWGMDNKEVIIYAYDPAEWTYELFSSSISQANQEWLLQRNMLALEDHPADPEIVNGVSMNQGTYALALVQNLSDLDVRAKQIAAKGFYSTWPEEYLKPLFKHRKDPRL